MIQTDGEGFISLGYLISELLRMTIEIWSCGQRQNHQAIFQIIKITCKVHLVCKMYYCFWATVVSCFGILIMMSCCWWFAFGLAVVIFNVIQCWVLKISLNLSKNALWQQHCVPCCASGMKWDTLLLVHIKTRYYQIQYKCSVLCFVF